MDFQQKLQSSGLNVTPVRFAETLTHNPHMEASRILDIVQEKIQTTTIQAVYKNVNTLIGHGLIREIKPKGMPTFYKPVLAITTTT
jgi:Fe2+ or Zn2+ uptake regulation protein